MPGLYYMRALPLEPAPNLALYAFRRRQPACPTSGLFFP